MSAIIKINNLIGTVVIINTDNTTKAEELAGIVSEALIKAVQSVTETNQKEQPNS